MLPGNAGAARWAGRAGRRGGRLRPRHFRDDGTAWRCCGTLWKMPIFARRRGHLRVARDEAALRRHNPLRHAVPRTYEVLARLLRMCWRRLPGQELRNEILIVATVLASQEASCAFPRLWHARRVARRTRVWTWAATCMYGTTSEEDFEPAAVWGCQEALAAGDAASLAAVEQSAFFGTLLASLQDPPTLAQAWGATQSALQLQALSVLTALPRACRSYGELGGNETAVRFLQTASSANILGEATPDLELQHGALQLVLHTSGLLDFPDRLGDLGALDVMLAVFNDPGMPVVMRRDAVATISQVCRGHEQNQTKLRRAEGVEALRACLAFDKLDAVNNNFLIVAVADAVWMPWSATAAAGPLPQRGRARRAARPAGDVPDLMQKQPLGAGRPMPQPARAAAFRVWKSRSYQCAPPRSCCRRCGRRRRRGWKCRGSTVARQQRRAAAGPRPPLTEAAMAKDADAPEGRAAPPRQRARAGGRQRGWSAFARWKALQAAKDMTPSERALREAVAPVDMRRKVPLQAVGFDEVSADLFEQEAHLRGGREPCTSARRAAGRRQGRAACAQREPYCRDALLLERKIGPASTAPWRPSASSRRFCRGRPRGQAAEQSSSTASCCSASKSCGAAPDAEGEPQSRRRRSRRRRRRRRTRWWPTRAHDCAALFNRCLDLDHVAFSGTRY